MKKMLTVILLLAVLMVSVPALAQIDVQSTQLSDDRFAARIHIAPDEEPVYIILDRLTIGGIPFDETGGDVSDMWSGYPQGTEKKSLTCEFFVQIEEGYIQPSVQDRAAALKSLAQMLEQPDPVAVSFRITLLAPKQEIVKVDCAFSGDSTDAWKQIDEIVSRGDTPVESDEPYTALIASGCMDEVRYDEPVCYPQGNVGALTEYANMVVVEQKLFELHGASVLSVHN